MDMSFLLDYDEPKQMIEEDLIPNRDSPTELKYITKAKAYLTRFGLVKTNTDFSTQWLNKSENYYALLLCEKRQPSISCIHNLLHNLQKASDVAEYDNKKGITTQLNRLISEGQNHLTKRLIKYL